MLKALLMETKLLTLENNSYKKALWKIILATHLVKKINIK